MVTISFLQITSNKWWAFKQMQLLPPELTKVSGVQFCKLLGTGSGFGFSLIPDLSTYALLIRWKDLASKEDFFKNASLFSTLQNKSDTINTYELESISAHGSWYGENPFPEQNEQKGEKIAVITRARISIRKLPLFWRYVPKASKAIQQATGLVFTKGIGEWPLIEQATFSVWDNKEAMTQYAYKNIHKEIVQKVKKERWYKEELFARFNILNQYTH